MILSKCLPCSTEQLPTSAVLNVTFKMVTKWSLSIQSFQRQNGLWVFSKRWDSHRPLSIQTAIFFLIFLLDIIYIHWNSQVINVQSVACLYMHRPIESPFILKYRNCLKGFFVPLYGRCLPHPWPQKLPLFEFLSPQICFICLELYIKGIVCRVVFFFFLNR